MMKTLLNHLLSSLLLAIVLIIPSQAQSQSYLTHESDSQPSLQQLMDAREVFEYEVRYGFLTLGWVKVELLPDSLHNGEKMHHIRTQIRSNSRVPFVGTRIVNYESLFQITEEYPFSHLFWRDDIHDDDLDRLRIIFDRDDELVYFYERGEPTDTLALNEPASGGDVIFYYSRIHAGLEAPYTLPVYTEGEMGPVIAATVPGTEMRSYDAFDGPVETYLSEGEAQIEGPFGFRGTFKSWFSTDDLRIPVEAHVRVIFGNVKVRIISYERHGTN